MLDVHAPEHGINGVRDFFLHLFTITIGLLIALGLEAGVEAIHHRHQREEAETLIRREIQNNLAQLHDGAPVATAELHQMTAVLQTLEDRAQSQPGVLHENDFIFHEAPIQDAAWRTANSTGALTYMDYKEVERFSDAYKEQALLQTMEEQALEDYLELLPILAHHGGDGTVTPEAAREAIPYTRRVVAHLNGMLAVGAGTVGTYEAALKQ
jgi:cell division protein FtsB